MIKTLKEATDLYNDIWGNASEHNSEKITKTIRVDKALFDNWEYSFFFHNGTLCKIEVYNHRELIECHVAD